MNPSNQIRIAALLMALAIALGAFGAHALEPRLLETGHVAEWKTATIYHLVHGLAMLLIAIGGRREKPSVSFWAWLIGILLFSGSLYVLSYTGNTAKPIVLSTPLGGLAFLIGWIALIVKPKQALFS